MNSQNNLIKVAKVFLIGVIAFNGVIAIGEGLLAMNISQLWVSIYRGILLTSVIGAIVWFFVRKEKQAAQMIGWQSGRQNLLSLLKGMGYLIGPIVITLLLSMAFGWASYRFNPNADYVWQQLVAILVVFLFEAFPEELLFRGYLFGKLNRAHKLGRSMAYAAILFLLLPVVSYPMQLLFLDNPGFGGSEGIQLGYMIYMGIFALITASLRHITNNIWTGIGFHTVFVSMNYLIGLNETSLIVIEDYSNELPIQIILLGCILLVIGLLYKQWKRQKTIAHIILEAE